VSDAPEQIGKIRLSAIAVEWLETQSFNPRLLAGEVASVLRTLPANQVLHSSVASATIYDTATGVGGITHGALADYFSFASQGTQPETISTGIDHALAAGVFISRTWINRVVDEAIQRAAAIAGYVSVANDQTSFSVAANGVPAKLTSPTPTPPNNALGYLKMHQVQQRQAGEKSAAEQLDTERNKAQQLAQENAELQAAINIKNAQIKALRTEVEDKDRETNTERRAKLKAENDAIELEEQLEEVMIFAECLRADNPLAPPELLLAFHCWCGITKDGTLDPARPGGTGVHKAVQSWLSRNGYTLNKCETERLCAVVSWRKRGSGAIRSL
jgi:hypothetical protein